MRALGVIALVAAAALLSACGDAEKPAAPPGSPENPLVAKPTQETSAGRSNEARAGSSEEPGFKELVERQPSKPQTRFTPCSLVTRAQAKAILGVSIQAPVEAPQGPTCVYRSESDTAFVTLAVQSADFNQLRKQIRRRRAVDVADRRAYCGVQGQSVLHVALSGGRVLSVGAPCAVARRFAALGLARLSG